MKLLAIALLVISLTGCGAVSREYAKLAGFDRQCIAGVSYLQFASGVSVEYTPDGRVKTCN